MCPSVIPITMPLTTSQEIPLPVCPLMHIFEALEPQDCRRGYRYDDIPSLSPLAVAPAMLSRPLEQMPQTANCLQPPSRHCHWSSWESPYWTLHAVVAVPVMSLSTTALPLGLVHMDRSSILTRLSTSNRTATSPKPWVFGRQGLLLLLHVYTAM